LSPALIAGISWSPVDSKGVNSPRAEDVKNDRTNGWYAKRIGSHDSAAVGDRTDQKKQFFGEVQRIGDWLDDRT
jgi:hypothetical protein